MKKAKRRNKKRDKVSFFSTLGTDSAKAVPQKQKFWLIIYYSYFPGQKIL